MRHRVWGTVVTRSREMLLAMPEPQSIVRLAMAEQLDVIVVIDVEATCWRGPPPTGQESEIIEIGVCTIDVAACERDERASFIVRPERSRVSGFCTELTSLTQAQVEQGLSFSAACDELKRRFRTERRTWASWSDFDRQIFDSQCKTSGVAYPFGATHLNIKNLFALAHALPDELRMDEAMRRSNLPLQGTHHRGDDDAWNIAALMINMLKALRRTGTLKD